MKTTYMKVINFLKSLLGFTLFNCFLAYLASPVIGVMIFRSFLSSSHYNDTLINILKEPNVLDAEILYTKGNPFWPESAAIRIVFNDGGSLNVNNVNEHGKGNMEIAYVDDYCIESSVKDGEYSLYNRNLELWSKILGVQLINITDCVKNYSAITQYVENMPNIHEHRNNYEIEKLSERRNNNLEREINSEVRKRLLAENMFTFVIIDGKEYYMYKWPSGHARVLGTHGRAHSGDRYYDTKYKERLVS
jgi:hypothetical protein